MFHLAGQIFLGIAIGITANPLMPGKGTRKALWIASIGLTGALLGTLVERSFLQSENSLAGWAISIIGTLFALALYRVFIRPRSAY